MAFESQFEHLKIKLEAIKLATNNFSEENCIGKGGFGKVYKGKITHSKGRTTVAIKRLDPKFGHGNPEFWKEVMILSFYKHENIVSLLGYCDDSVEKILVYEYVSKKSLDFYLQNEELSWVIRLKICIGAARGLSYLHTPVGTQQRVLHRDIKSSNILLDEYWNAKISDFGLSKFAPVNQELTYMVSNAVGTFGYCDPVYAETGLLTKESDVYSFGVVLFEVLCGRLCFHNNNNKGQPLIGLVREYYEENKIGELIYGRIKDEITPESLKSITKIAYQCLNREPKERPLMKEILRELETLYFYECHGDSVQGTQIDGILKVKVIRGMALKKKNTYVILEMMNGNFNSKEKTTVKHQTVNPEWNEEFTLYVERFDYQALNISLKNVVSEEKHEHVGLVRYTLRQLIPGKPHTETLDLVKYHLHQSPKGKIVVEIVYKPFTSYRILKDVCPVEKAPPGTPRDGGLLVVIIRDYVSNLVLKKARLEKAKHHTNLSVSLLSQGELTKPMHIKNCGAPLWDQELAFTLEQPPNDEDQLHIEATRTPRDNGGRCMRLPFRRNEIMESVDFWNISLANVVNKRRVNKTCCDKSKESYLDTLIYLEVQWRTSD